MAEAIILKKSERQRLARLAREADCGIGEILRDVLRDGFDYTEYKVMAVNEGLAYRPARGAQAAGHQCPGCIP